MSRTWNNAGRRMAAVAEQGPTLGQRLAQSGGGVAAYARRLVRTLDSLCEHYEKLGGAEICPACDKQIRCEKPSALSDYLSPSGATARSTRIHTHCANTVRRQ
ncbi:hypothetical protein [Streptomyces sp. KR55]|uniref:hypothetical protein n=1 Tax=Streptomyces sp. KR55 TaxID=3457425 RepID=UPI003FD376CB